MPRAYCANLHVFASPLDCLIYAPTYTRPDILLLLRAIWLLHMRLLRCHQGRRESNLLVR